MEVLKWLEGVFDAYGYLVLLLGLPLDFIALPLPPGQTTLAYTGYLASQGILPLLPAALAAFAGAALGVTITYGIGYHAGARILEKFGRRLFLKPEHLEKAREQYRRYGNRFLLASFFIPGVRQFAGYAVGTLRVPFRTFAPYAYAGAAAWTAAFVGIGYFLGDQWQSVLAAVERNFAILIAVAVIAGLVFFMIRKFRKPAPPGIPPQGGRQPRN